MMNDLVPYVRNQRPLTSLFNNDWFEKLLSDNFDYIFKKDKEGNRYIEIEVPGFNSENLEVILDQGYLTVFGEREGRQLNKSIFLGNGVNEVSGSVKDGLLKVYLETEGVETKKISIKQE